MRSSSAASCRSPVICARCAARRPLRWQPGGGRAGVARRQRRPRPRSPGARACCPPPAVGRRVHILNGHTALEPVAEAGPPPLAGRSVPDLADARPVAGAPVLEVAAGGAHSLLLFGPPGTGKSMLASARPARCRHERGLRV